MRKIIVSEMVSLDGVMQGPGGSKEDSDEGFSLSGWTAPYVDDESMKVMNEQMVQSDYLLGRKTFDIWEAYWPDHGDFWPGINAGTKYVLSNTRDSTDWENTVFIKSVEDIKKLKETDGPDLQVWGSSKLAQLLFKNNLVDEIWLKTYPVILGQGKKLFDESFDASAFALTESHIVPSGVVMANYEKAGEIRTGDIEV